MTLSIAEYAYQLERSGHSVAVDNSGTYWRRADGGALVRMPTMELSEPSPNEVNRILWTRRAPVVSYIAEPDETHPADAFLYLCRDRSYSLEKVPKNARLCIRKAISALQFGWLNQESLLQHGFPAFRDTRVRNGLSDSSLEAFRLNYGRWFDIPANGALGAWKDGALVAFFTTTTVDDWADIGGQSTNAGLAFSPNNGLVHHLLTYFLTERGLRAVSYGLSSIQEHSSAEGLHQFKIRVGFEAIPVRRIFVVHPLLRPFANRFSLAMGHGALRLLPGNRLLKKGCGMLARLIEANL